MERKLAAILAADVIGFSHLVGEDETGTLAALKSHRQDLIDPEITQRGGRIFKTTSDGALVEFPSMLVMWTARIGSPRACVGHGLRGQSGQARGSH